ncbi:4a-hydroxytetrahydrobiopterin dehydratase [Neotabrizicola sp. sgz301269]|uniref:4a-hydroxytetrahydrobiopterin dehydratase n=1 Tax=Neotabrizicola sp. sgz301269 TaxID=3276282 RepID=UPI00377035CF
MPATLLTDQDRKAHLPALGRAGWQAVEGEDAIRKIWKFRNFSQAWGFMSRAALKSEAMNHHPDWRNVYNVVDVTLSTHSAKGLTQLDVDLALAFDKMAGDAETQTDHGAPIECLCGTAPKAE